MVKSKIPEYSIWKGMRCRVRHNAVYIRKGIAVCAAWQRFEQFYEDMGKRPTPNHTLERIDNSLGYFADNCRWATVHEQTRNKDNNIWITHLGETQILKDWCDSLNLDYATVWIRLSKGEAPPYLFRKSNRPILHRNGESMGLKAWSRRSDTPSYRTIQRRYKAGLPDEEILA